MGEGRIRLALQLAGLAGALFVSCQALFIYGFLYHLPRSLRYLIDLSSLASVSFDLAYSVAISLLVSTYLYYGLYSMLLIAAGLLIFRIKMIKRSRVFLRGTLRYMRRFRFLVKGVIFMFSLNATFLDGAVGAPIPIAVFSVLFSGFFLVFYSNARASSPLLNKDFHSLQWPQSYELERRAKLTYSAAFLSVAIGSVMLGAMKFESRHEEHVRLFLLDETMDRVIVISTREGIIVRCDIAQCGDRESPEFQFINFDVIKRISVE